MWLILSFGLTGILIGNLIAMSASSTVPSLVSLIFAFVGGSLVVMLHRLKQDEQVLAGKILASLSFFCLVGVYMGLIVNEGRLLTPERWRQAHPQTSRVQAPGECTETKLQDSKYLASDGISRGDAIDMLKTAGALSAEQAYFQLFNEYKALSKEMKQCK
ncbi:hypothetical protein [Granulicella arctica]|uniref:hypothetical protein n=1 Tax=Granulicella arctica TaxID=940613 RepID=UPI0021E03C2E|nr:hypothetical protein [Granulicella arctica]